MSVCFSPRKVLCDTRVRCLTACQRLCSPIAFWSSELAIAMALGAQLLLVQQLLRHYMTLTMNRRGRNVKLSARTAVGHPSSCTSPLKTPMNSACIFGPHDKRPGTDPPARGLTRAERRQSRVWSVSPSHHTCALPHHFRPLRVINTCLSQ